MGKYLAFAKWDLRATNLDRTVGIIKYSFILYKQNDMIIYILN